MNQEPNQDPWRRHVQWMMENLDEIGTAVGQQANQTMGRVRETIKERSENVTTMAGDGDDLRDVSSQVGPLRVRTSSRIGLDEKDVAGIAAFAAAAGILANEVEITRFTRSVMDSDTGPLQGLMEKILDPARASEIGAWMDQVPGSAVAGGWAHRLHHGHDLQSLGTLVNEEGIGAAAHWMNHVLLRDFWTPHGVPWLPGGSADAHEVLVALGVSPSTALDLLAINVAEAAGITLFTLSMWRAGLLIRTKAANRGYSEKFELVKQAIVNHNTAVALECFRDMELQPSDAVSVQLRLQSATLSMDKACDAALCEDERSEWAMCAYSTAEAVCRKKDEVVSFLGNTQSTSHGLAAIVLCNAAARLRNDRRVPRDSLMSRAEVGVGALIRIAEKQSKPNWLLLDRGYRPYSAVVNLELAMQIARSFEYSGRMIRSKDSRAIKARRRQTLQSAFDHLGDRHKEFIRMLWMDREDSAMPEVARG